MVCTSEIPACCIPISGNLCTSDGERADCFGVVNNDSSMVIRSGPHRFHAIASRDVKAGTVIVQCLPLAHSLLVPPGMQGEELSIDDSGAPKRCARCFASEGDRHCPRKTEGKFGRCSKCRVVSYCSRTCQTEDWKEQHKLECQYYVKRRKLSIGPPQCAEDEAIPILLRTFTKLKYMRENSLHNKSSGVCDNVMYQGEPLISCGPAHFSSMSVSQEMFTSNTYLKIPFMTPALSLARELMESFAVRGEDLNQNRTRAALAIWGYGDKPNNRFCRTLDQAMRWASNAFERNNFGVVNVLHSSIGEGVYPCAALLNHSCSPNCILRYKLGISHHQCEDTYYEPILQIVASRDICSGEELCHSYVDLTHPTETRRSRLMETHGFVCECTRCVAGGCLVQLPKDRNHWAMWPLMRGLRTHGGFDNDKESVSLIDIGMDDAMSWCRGLGEEEQTRVNNQSELLQQRARNSMLEDDAFNELRHLKKSVSLYNIKGNKSWSPFHLKLYVVRSLYLTSLLSCGGDMADAIEQCEHIVSHLALVTSHVENHPLLGLQLFTLGDLYLRAIFNKTTSSLSNLHYKLKARAAFRWAQKVMSVSHGQDDAFVKNLEENIATITENM